MKAVTWKMLLLTKKVEIIDGIKDYCSESFFVECSISNASEVDRERYGANAELVTMRAIAYFGLAHQRRQFEAAREYLDIDNSFYPEKCCEFDRGFIDKGITSGDLSADERIRFSALFSEKQRRAMERKEAA